MNCSDDTGRCAHCDRRLGLTAHGTLTSHGPIRGRCAGSGQPPLTGSIRSRSSVSASATSSVTSPPPPGLSASRWEEIVRAGRQMDERANVHVATTPARFLS